MPNAVKTALVLAIVVAAVLLAGFAWWKARPIGASPSDQTSTTEAAPSGSSTGLSRESSGRPESARSEVAPPTIAAPVLAADPKAPNAAPPPAIAKSIQADEEDRKHDDEAGDLVFAGKYAGMNAEARREALESLRAILEGNAGGGPGNEETLTERRTVELKREVEWLANHSSP